MTNQLLRTAKQALLAFAVATIFAACDPCDGVVCDNGTCANGTCVCEPGYERIMTACEAINKRYVQQSDSTITGNVLIVDAQGNSNQFSNIGYTFSRDDSKPLEFALKRFDFIADNDIIFQINPQKYNVLEGGTVTTAAGRSYTYSGAKVGSQVQLRITDDQQQKTHTITYEV